MQLFLTLYLSPAFLLGIALGEEIVIEEEIQSEQNENTD